MNVEGSDMAVCPKCKATMHLENNKMVCPNLACTYQYELTRPVASQADLLKENEELKTYIVTLEDILDDLGYQGSHRKPRQTAQNDK